MSQVQLVHNYIFEVDLLIKDFADFMDIVHYTLLHKLHGKGYHDLLQARGLYILYN